MRVLVTGGTGFIGSNLAVKLLEEGYGVTITGTDAEQKVPGAAYLQPGFLGIDWAVLGKFDLLFHQAAINDTTLMDKREMFRANVTASAELFRYVARNGCKRIVYASSTAVYGNLPAPYKENCPVQPLNPYGESKAELDDYARQFASEYSDVVIVGLRYCNVYGPRENHKGKRASMIYQLAQQMKNCNPRIFKHGEQKRDYIYVSDVVQANLLAAKAEKSCIVNCGSGAAITFNDLIKILNKVMGTTRQPEYIDNPYADKYQSHTECDMALAKEKIGFVPQYDIERGINEYYARGWLI